MKKFLGIIFKPLNDRGSPFVLKFKKFDLNEAPIHEISLKKKSISKKIGNVRLPILYPNGRPIDKKKFDDLKGLLKYVPEEHHAFFDTLKFIDKEKE